MESESAVVENKNANAENDKRGNFDQADGDEEPDTERQQNGDANNQDGK